jgi:hypothetical protein
MTVKYIVIIITMNSDQLKTSLVFGQNEYSARAAKKQKKSYLLTFDF